MTDYPPHDYPPSAPPASGRGEGSAVAPLPLAGGVGGGPVTNNPSDHQTSQPRGQFKPRNTSRARELRNQATPAERQLWKALSNRQLNGFKFSRQMPIGPSFADFLCREAMLVIEVDGFSHDLRQEADQRRDSYMAGQGYRVLRVTNADVMTNLAGVVQVISAVLMRTDPPPTPPASGRGVCHAALPTSTLGEGAGMEFVGLGDVVCWRPK